MPVRIRTGGAWYGPIADGYIRMRVNGAWYGTGAARVAVGGQWVDLGYHGYPNPPANLRVYAWNYDYCQVTWDAAAPGGPQIAYYLVVMTDAAGNWIQQENSTDLYSPGWPVAHDTNYQFYVQSVATNGLGSAAVYGWLGPLRVAIGHPQVMGTQTVTNPYPWQGIANPNLLYRDEAFNTPNQIYVPATVVTNTMTVHLQVNDTTSSFAPGGSNNRFAYVVNTGNPPPGASATTLNKPNPWHEAFSFVQSSPGWAGITLHGSSWASGPTAPPSWTVNSVPGYNGITIDGTEYRVEQVPVVVVAEKGNGYW